MMQDTRIQDIRVNGTAQPFSPQTLADLVAEASTMPEGRGVAVALNGAVVRRADWSGTPLRPGDVIEIVQAKQGG